MKQSTMIWFALFALVLAACSPAQAPVPSDIQPTNQPSSVLPSTSQPSVKDLTRSDSQGAVVVEIKPLNLDNPADTLLFEVSLNTHSVDLSMDLAALATLTTDTGHTVEAAHWDAPRGGHHVSGTLSFPATWDGAPLLEGASMLTLSIQNLDASLRMFNWNLSH